MKSMDRELSIVSMLKACLKSWKMILIGAVTLTLLGTTAKYALDMSNYKKALEVQDQAGQAQLTEEEIAQIDNVVELQKSIEEKEDYLNTSWLMNTDPFAVPVYAMTCSIEGVELAPENMINAKALIRHYVDTNEMITDIASTENDMTESMVNEVLEYSGFDDTSKYFMIKITGITQEQNQQLADLVKENLNSFLTEELGDGIEVSVAREVSSTESSLELDNKQQNMKETLLLEQTEYDTARNALSDNQKLYLNEEIEKVAITKPAISMKITALFMIVGILIMVVVVVLRYMISNKLQNLEELSELCKMLCLGVVSGKGSKEQIDYVMQNIIQYKRQKEITEKISLISSICKDEVTYKFVQEIEAQSDEIEFVAGVMDNIAQQNTIIAKGQIVLVERENVSNYNSIVQEIEFAQENGIKILGYIYVR